jgi:hypothetical protein
MVETTADVRRDIELTRERMSSTLAQLEHKLNVVELVREHPWPALAAAIGVGVLLSGSGADVKAAAATAAATRGASDRVGPALDDLVATLVTAVSTAFEQRVQGWVDEVKNAIGAPAGSGASVAGRPARDVGFGTGPAHEAAGIPQGAQPPARAD